MPKAIKISEVSVLCQNCTKVKECLKDRLKAIFMSSTTYCTRFDSKDKVYFPYYNLMRLNVRMQSLSIIKKKYGKNTL